MTLRGKGLLFRAFLMLLINFSLHRESLVLVRSSSSPAKFDPLSPGKDSLEGMLTVRNLSELELKSQHGTSFPRKYVVEEANNPGMVPKGNQSGPASMATNGEDGADGRSRRNGQEARAKLMRNQRLIANLRFISEGVITSVLIAFGLVGNLVSAYVLLQHKLDLRPFLTRLLVLLTIYDSTFLTGGFFLISLPVMSTTYDMTWKNILVPCLLSPMCQIALTGSVYTIIAITIERYLSCCWPHLPPRESLKMSMVAFGTLIVFPILYNIGRFFEYSTDILKHPVSANQSSNGEMNETTYYQLSNSWLRDHPVYIKYYLTASNVTVMVLIPFILLLTLNWKIHTAIQRREAFKASLANRIVVGSNGSPNSPNTEGQAVEAARKQRDFTITKLLVAIVVIFLMCHTFKVILVSMETFSLIYYDKLLMTSLTVELLIMANHTTLVFNAAINIVIYISKDKKFRTAVFNLFPIVKRLASNSESLDGLANNSMSLRRNQNAPPPNSGSATPAPMLVPKRDVVVELGSSSHTMLPGQRTANGSPVARIHLQSPDLTDKSPKSEICLCPTNNVKVELSTPHTEKSSLIV